MQSSRRRRPPAPFPIDIVGPEWSLWLLAAVSFAESSFFPVPPDIMLVPMALAKPQRAWLYASVCTIASVLGGVLGYAIGYLLYDSVGQWLIHLYGYGDKVEAFRTSYAQYGAWIILLKGLTPIPFKIVTITSGFAGYNIWLFVLFSIITRARRCGTSASVAVRFGVGNRGNRMPNTRNRMSITRRILRKRALSSGSPSQGRTYSR